MMFVALHFVFVFFCLLFLLPDCFKQINESFLAFFAYYLLFGDAEVSVLIFHSFFYFHFKVLPSPFKLFFYSGRNKIQVQFLNDLNHLLSHSIFLISPILVVKINLLKMGLKEFWNERYMSDDYAFGEAPNEYLKSMLTPLPPGKILFPAW